MTELLDLLINGGVSVLFDIFDALLNILPNDPFLIMIALVPESEFLGYLNYFIPFDFMASCLNTWLICVGIYYAYKYLKPIIEAFIKSKLP